MSDIDGHIQERATETAHKFALRKGRQLKM
jgi:hypothetical protein